MINFEKDVMPLKNKFYRLALRVLRNNAEAQDITQETLIRLWKRSATLQDGAEAEALGMTICHNLALDTLGRAGRDYEQLDNQTDTIVSDHGASPHDDLTRQEQRQQLRRQIDLLPTRQRTVLQLRDIEGYSYKEIAETLNINEEQVKVTLFRARQALKLSLQNKAYHGL